MNFSRQGMNQPRRRTITGGAERAAAGGNGRVIRYRLSDPSVGRDGHTIAADAWVLDNYLKNPVVLWAHDASEPPIGRVVEIGTVGDRLMGSVEYPEPEVYPFADTVYRLVKGGYLNATSTGWLPLTWKFSQDRERPGGIDFTLVELLELSQVPVPALSTALVAARAAGIDTGPLYQWAEKVLDTSEKTLMPRPELELICRAAKMPTTTTLHEFSRRPSLPAQPRVSGEFASFTDYLKALVRAARGDATDRRLVRAPTGLSEGDPTAGGFLVPEVFAEDLVTSLYKSGQIGARCDRQTTTRPIADVVLPAVDETSRADGSRYGSVLAYWASEAETISSTFPRWRRVAFAGYKLIGIGFATSETIADSPLFEAGLRDAFAQELGFAVDHVVLVGSGARQAVGVVSSPCTITVAKESGQAAATIVAANVLNMYDRLVADCRGRACWFVNPDCEPQLRNLALVIGTAGAALWSWNSDASPYPRLLGLPVISTEHNPALGTVGDIVLADLSAYRIVDQDPKTAVSFDAALLSDQVVFRMTYRVDRIVTIR